ncbi:MAG TPA: hypothetical protein VNH83_26880 [Bryobacteraceae bacterium]|nr:hypothetical protein [Bryobacteraceae bacterium]
MLASATLRAEDTGLKPNCITKTTGTSGAAVQIATDASIMVNAIFIKPFTGAGACYVGVSGITPSTGVGVIADLVTVPSTFFIQSQNGTNQLCLADYWVAGTNTSDKVLVSYWIA